MKKTFLILALAVITAIGVLSIVSADMPSAMATATTTIVTPDSLKWTPVKGIDGAWMATVYGDPTKAGSLYTIRLKLADGVKVPVHWHDDTERVTVLSGTFLFAAGHSWDASALKPLTPGTFMLIPAKLHHYASAKGETIVQSTGTGPMTMNLMK
ncbi:MAG TPA: cupin domain-containing protein [Candidatus Eremiobacteraceae bacterium]|nr:cupin domain-containing protein [Candidatus Eremiobacteraceae bacterium]